MHKARVRITLCYGFWLWIGRNQKEELRHGLDFIEKGSQKINEI
jgi:hypothetical protein